MHDIRGVSTFRNFLSRSLIRSSIYRMPKNMIIQNMRCFICEKRELIKRISVFITTTLLLPCTVIIWAAVHNCILYKIHSDQFCSRSCNQLFNSASASHSLRKPCTYICVLFVSLSLLSTQERLVSLSISATQRRENG